MLINQPQFADKCDKWDEFTGDDWLQLLLCQPQFADKCDWGKLNGNDWSELLIHQPQFADRFNEWSEIKSWELVDFFGKS